MFKLMRVACLVLSFILPFVVLPAGVAASGMVSSKGSEMQKIIPSSSSTSENSDSTNSAKKTKKEETVEDKNRIMSDVVLSTETNNACLILPPALSPVSLIASVSETSTTAKEKERKTFEVEQHHAITTSSADINTTISNIEQIGGISINDIGSGPSIDISNTTTLIGMIEPPRIPHKYPSNEVKSVIEALVNGDKFALLRALNAHPVPDLSLEDATGRTPLDYALAESPSDFAPLAIRILMAYKAVPGTSKESQALQLARLVASDAPINAFPEKPSVDTRLPNGFTPFLWAAVLASRADTLEHLLNAGADLHQCLPGHKGENESLSRNDALFLAVRWNPHYEATHFLIRKGLDPTLPSSGGQTPLMEACHAGNFDAVEALFHAGVELESADTNGMTAFLIAASKSNMPMMQRLVIAGANPSAASREGMTALHFLLKKGVSGNSVSWLLSLGVPINAKLCRAKGELTPLMLAVRRLNPQVSVIRSLLDNGADPKLRDGAGRRAVDGLSTEQIRWLKQNDLYGLLNQ